MENFHYQNGSGSFRPSRRGEFWFDPISILRDLWFGYDEQLPWPF